MDRKPCLNKRIVCPLKQRLALSEPTCLVPFPRRAAAAQGSRMTPKGSPSSDLNVIETQNPPSHPVPTVPLKPTAFIGIAVRIAQGPVIMIIDTTSTRGRRGPPVGPPNRQRLTRLHAKHITACRIRSLGRQTTEVEAAPEPLGRKFCNTVVQILSLKDTEQQHFSRTQIGCKGGIAF